MKEKAVPVKAINKSTVDAIHSTASVEDKKLRRDGDRIKQMLIMMEIKSVFCCPGRDELDDCVTEENRNIIQIDASVEVKKEMDDQILKTYNQFFKCQ